MFTLHSLLEVVSTQRLLALPGQSPRMLTFTEFEMICKYASACAVSAAAVASHNAVAGNLRRFSRLCYDSRRFFASVTLVNGSGTPFGRSGGRWALPVSQRVCTDE